MCNFGKLVYRALGRFHEPFGCAARAHAGGRTTPKKALTYVFDFEGDGCMISVGSIDELKEDIEAAINENMLQVNGNVCI